MPPGTTRALRAISLRRSRSLLGLLAASAFLRRLTARTIPETKRIGNATCLRPRGHGQCRNDGMRAAGGDGWSALAARPQQEQRHGCRALPLPELNRSRRLATQGALRDLLAAALHRQFRRRGPRQIARHDRRAPAVRREREMIIRRCWIDTSSGRRVVFSSRGCAIGSGRSWASPTHREPQWHRLALDAPLGPALRDCLRNVQHAAAAFRVTTGFVRHLCPSLPRLCGSVTISCCRAAVTLPSLTHVGHRSSSSRSVASAYVRDAPYSRARPSSP